MLCVCILFSCGKNSTLNDLERIKKVGDDNPVTALSMLDSLEVGIRNENDYIKHKYVLYGTMYFYNRFFTELRRKKKWLLNWNWKMSICQKLK